MRAQSKAWLITLPQTAASWLTTSFGISLKVSQKLMLQVHVVFLCLASFSASVSQQRPHFSWHPRPKCIHLEGSPANFSGTHLIWLRYGLPVWSRQYTWTSIFTELLLLRSLLFSNILWLAKWASLTAILPVICMEIILKWVCNCVGICIFCLWVSLGQWLFLRNMSDFLGAS